jgi:muramidase (phage lysozyme)
MNRAAVLFGVSAALGAAAWLAWQRELRGTGLALADYGLEPPPGLPELEGELAPILTTLEDLVGLGPSAEEVSAMTAESNVAAFLAMIRAAEGTAGPNGYRTLFGGQLFASYADHPRIAVRALLGGRAITSTAAGAYQILERTWDEAARALALPDFSPASQDAAAVWLIRRRGALADVRAGRFDVAVRKVAREWASLPGSPYGQPVKTLDEVRAAYAAAGGSFA